MSGEFRALTDEQLSDLRLHLSTVLQPDELVSAVSAIAWAANCVAAVPPGEGRRMLADRYQHMAAIAEAARRLRSLLLVERPLPGTAGLDWAMVDTTLGRVGASAQTEADAYRPPPGAGRPPDVWRDMLVSIIFSVYPPGGATKARGSHAENTVKKVLSYLGRNVNDVHGVILDALCREPEPAFTVRQARRRR